MGRNFKRGTSFEGVNAIITGANRGLGKALLKRFAECHIHIWALVRKKTEEFEKYIQTLSKENDVAIQAICVDLESEDSIKAAFREISKENRSIDILINNAGIGHMALFQMTKMEFVNKLYRVNVFAPMMLSQLVFRKMSRQHYGKIINVASTAADEIYEGNAVYGSSKAALVAFTQSFAAEAYRYGVTINAIAPGLIHTDMSVVFEGKDPGEPLRHTVLERKMEPEEVAAVVMHLLSDELNIINGALITVNGGHK